MINFEYFNPTRIVFGKDTENEIGKLIKPYANKILILHYGDDFLNLIGIKESIYSSLEQYGIEAIEMGGVKPNPRLDHVYEGIELCKKENIDFILAVGGGSVIDAAKAIATGIRYDGDVWDFFTGKAVIKDVAPVGVILTIPAAGSETSDGSIILNEKTNDKAIGASDLMRPKFAILNPCLTYGLPQYQTACGIADMFSHILERYFTQTKNVDLSDRLCEANLKNVLCYAPKVMNNPTDYDARAEIMWSGSVGNNTLENMGRQADWATHLIQHPLGALYDMAHGAGLTIMTPAWMKYVYKDNINRFVQFAIKVMGVDESFDDLEYIAMQGIAKVEEFFKGLGLPTRLSDIDIDDKDFDKVAELATKGGTIGAFKVLDKQDVIKILELAL